MEVGKRVRVISNYTFEGQEGVVTQVLENQRIMVRLDRDHEEWPFDEEELKVIS